MVFLLSPQGALSENMRKCIGFLAVPPGGPQRKLKGIHVVSLRSLREPSAKTAGSHTVFLLPPMNFQRKLKEPIWFSRGPARGALSENEKKTSNCFPAIPPGCPQRNVRKSYGFPGVPQGALGETCGNHMVFLRSPQGALSET